MRVQGWRRRIDRGSIWSFALATAILALAPAAYACAPAQVVRIVYRNISPGVPAAASEAQPRTLWRIGSSFLRSEEQPDPTTGMKTLILVSEPNIWIVNLTDRTGSHSIDPDPSGKIRAPIIPLTDVPPPFLSLEYGCEAEFVAAYAPQAQSVRPWGDTLAELHVLRVAEHSLAILMDSRRKTPLLISYLRSGQPLLVIRYDDHRTGLKEREDLFRPPSSVKFKEVAGDPLLER